MRKPKNKDYVFLVYRQGGTPIATFRSLDEAILYAGVCEQEWVDKNLEGVWFDVATVIYYDK
jgi:hypothetical protein